VKKKKTEKDVGLDMVFFFAVAQGQGQAVPVPVPAPNVAEDDEEMPDVDAADPTTQLDDQWNPLSTALKAITYFRFEYGRNGTDTAKLTHIEQYTTAATFAREEVHERRVRRQTTRRRMKDIAKRFGKEGEAQGKRGMERDGQRRGGS